MDTESRFKNFDLTKYNQAKISMPKLTGARLRARELVNNLELESLDDVLVILDASKMEASSQSFADEFVDQVLEHSENSLLEVLKPTDRFAAHLKDAARRRKASERLEVIVRKFS